MFPEDFHQQHKLAVVHGTPHRHIYCTETTLSKRIHNLKINLDFNFSKVKLGVI